jgi:drug/metabolite transporter (DMT)-like permease
LMVVREEAPQRPPPPPHQQQRRAAAGYGSMEPVERMKEADAVVDAPQRPGSVRLMAIESTLCAREAGAEAQDLSLSVTYSVNWLGYAILAVAVACVASQGAAVKWLPSVPGATTASWLMQVQAALCAPLAAAQLVALPGKQRSAVLADGDAARLLVAASVAQVSWAAGFFIAADYTSLTRAWVLNNSHAVLIVLLAIATGQRCSRGQVAGVWLAVAGIALMQVPVLFGRGLVPLAGDAVAVASSLGAIAFLDLCGRLRARMPLFCFMAPVSALNALLFALVAYVGQGGDFSVSDTGAFGWMAADRRAYGLYLGGVVGVLGTVSCVAALAHLPSVVVSVAQTLMPPVGTLTAVLLGVERAPGTFTTLGGGVMVAGVLLIAKATSSKEVHVDLNPRPETV